MMLANGTKISDEIEKMMNSMSLRNAIFFSPTSMQVMMIHPIPGIKIPQKKSKIAKKNKKSQKKIKILKKIKNRKKSKS